MKQNHTFIIILPGRKPKPSTPPRVQCYKPLEPSNIQCIYKLIKCTFTPYCTMLSISVCYLYFGMWYNSHSIGRRGGVVVHFFLGGPRLMKSWCWSEAIWGSWFSLGRAMAVFLYSWFNKKDNYKKNHAYICSSASLPVHVPVSIIGSDIW